MFRTHKLLCAIFVAVMILAPTIQAMAAGHNVLTYQGILTDSTGPNLNGSHNLIFKIYNDPTTTTDIWSETHSAVAVVNGLFTAILGQTQLD